MCWPLIQALSPHTSTLPSFYAWPVASFTKEVNSRLAKCPLVFNGRSANRWLTSLVKGATGGSHGTGVFPRYNNIVEGPHRQDKWTHLKVAMNINILNTVVSPLAISQSGCIIFGQTSILQFPQLCSWWGFPLHQTAHCNTSWETLLWNNVKGWSY